MKTIEKKVMPDYFAAVKSRAKTFELRYDESNYKVGDILVLCEWTGSEYTGNKVVREITYILRDYPGLEPGFCILAIQAKGWDMFGTPAVLDVSDKRTCNG